MPGIAYFGIWLSVIATLFMSCSNLGGIGHEGEAKISGQLIFEDGTPASRTSVELYPENYDPIKVVDKIPLVNTTNQGTFTFSNISPGTYTIYAVHHQKGFKTLIDGIKVKEDSTIVIDKHMLQKTGSLKVILPNDFITINGYVYIPGTSIYSLVNNHEYIILDSVPAGKISQIAYSASNDTISHTLRYEIPVQPDHFETLYNAGWKYTCNIILNTKSSGANVSGNIFHFPACIRLTSDNFDFKNALPDGSDIRFKKSDNSPLTYEIERWDFQSAIAEVWVNIDTVYGNNDTQTIQMYWGNEHANKESNSLSVFDTSNGYVAVWHCDNNFTDATCNKHNSIAVNPLDTFGVIGLCKKFNGSDSIVIPGLLGTPGTLTLSAWAQLDSTTPGGGSEVLTIGDAVLIRMDYEKDSVGTIGSIHRSEGTYFSNTTSNRFLKKSGWHFFTFSVDINNLTRTLYIDGTKVNTVTNTSVPINYEGVGLNTLIGKHGNGKPEFGFIGRIDEVRVYNKSVSSDYVKLCFMNQKENDALVQFETGYVK